MSTKLLSQVVQALTATRNIAVLLVLAGACASLPPPPAHLIQPAQKQPPTPTSTTAATPPILRLRPGDVLEVQLQTATPQTVTNIFVDEDGAIFVPLAGEVHVGNMTLAEAASTITDALRPLEPDAEAFVLLSEPAGQRVTVLGAVMRPGRIEITGSKRLSELVADCGGLQTVPSPVDGRPIVVADLDHAKLVRQDKSLPVDFARALEGFPEDDIFVQPDDYLYLPPLEGSTISVLGQVGSPSVLPYWSGARLTQVLAAAGGVTKGADKRDIRVLRGPPEKPLVYSADFRAIVDGEGPDVAVQKGDVIFVTDHPIEDIGEVFGLLGGLTGITSALVTFLMITGL